MPGGVVGHQRRALGQREHEDEVEEELERHHLVAVAQDRVDAVGAGAGHPVSFSSSSQARILLRPPASVSPSLGTHRPFAPRSVDGEVRSPRLYPG